MPCVWRLLAVGLSLLGAGPAGWCEEAARPAYASLRYDEDWAFLAEATAHSDLWDPIKFIPLDPQRRTYLTLGGEARWRYEYFRNYNWGQGPQDDDGYLLQRYLLHADLRLGTRVRLFGQLESAWVNGRNGGPRPYIDENRADLHQVFIDVTPWIGAGASFTLRAGRQELQFGAGRLLAGGDGFNARRKFDGVRTILRTGQWEWDAMVMRLVVPLPDEFDDEPERDRRFWGLGGAGPSPWGHRTGHSLYYYGVDRDNAVYARGAGSELRHTVGSRLWMVSGSTDLELDGMVQWGEFRTGSIAAWAIIATVGTTFSQWTSRPRLGVRASATSGDSDPTSSTLRTFSPLFPDPTYGGRTARLGAGNSVSVVPAVRYGLNAAIALSAEWGFYWRQSVHDGIYSALGGVLRTGPSSVARYVGSQPSVWLDWQIDPHLTLTFSYTHFFAGRFLKETPPGEDTDFVYAQVRYRF